MFANTHLILLVNPHQEGLVFVVIDASSLRPVPLHATNNEVRVAGDKEEVVVYQLLSGDEMGELKITYNSVWIKGRYFSCAMSGIKAFLIS